MKAKKGIKIKSAGIMIAPEVFEVKEKIYLPDGHVVVEGSKYFSWPTAQSILAAKGAPSGWRMPTLAEAESIRDYYSKGRPKTPIFELGGFIAPGDMVVYKYMPKDAVKLIDRLGQLGCYWTSGLHDSLYPYVLANIGGNIWTGKYFYLQYGLQMLLVKDL